MGQAKLIEGLLDAVTRSRLETGRTPRYAVAVARCVWLVASTTVRAPKPAPLDVPLPPKKRAASLGIAIRVARA